MKRILKMTALALIIVLSSSVGFRASAQSDDYYDESRDVDYQTFYDELSPHGNWVEYPGHGYVWQPSMGPDFRPYSTGGHWVWSDNYEWVWVSDYDWGWAPFHYGRWFHDASYGWLWVPGYEWSGAWVTWRDGGDYYGWAPIRPGISISINFNIGGYSPPIDWWSFTPRRHILSRNIYSHCIDYRRNVTIINYTTIINNYHYGDRYGWRSGPRRYDAERYTGRINPVRFRNSSSPGRSTFRNNEVSIYRPNVRRDNNNTGVAPRKFDRYDRNGNNGTVRTNERPNGGFRRNENTNPGNRDIDTRNNERPNRDRTIRPQTNDNNGNSPRRIERNNNEQPNRERVIRQPQTNNNNGNNPRRFERNNGNNNEQPNREPRTRPERTERVDQPVNNNTRRFERSDNNNAPSPRQAPQRIEERRQAPQQVERRQAPQQMERRQSPQRVEQPRQQQQNKQVERRGNDNPQRSSERRSDDGNNGRGNGNGKRRF